MDRNKREKSLRTAKKRLKKKPGDGRGKNPNSLANLEDHKFQPGVSGNPGGRPKLLSDAYKEWLAQEEKGKTNAMVIAETMGKQAIEGDVSAAREMRAATEGDKLNFETPVLVKVDR